MQGRRCESDGGIDVATEARFLPLGARGRKGGPAQGAFSCSVTPWAAIIRMTAGRTFTRSVQRLMFARR